MAARSPETRVKIPAGVLSQELAGETVLLNLNTGVYFGLDPIGTRIWRLLQTGQPLGVIRETLCEEYDVGASRLEDDLSRFLRELGRHGLIEHG